MASEPPIPQEVPQSPGSDGAPRAPEDEQGFEDLFATIGLSWHEHKDLMQLLKDLPRYVRLNPRASIPRQEIHAALQAVGAVSVPWLPAALAFYELPATYSPSACALYTNAHVYGMDAASGAAVMVLGPRPGESVLDLCCCPGAKLCLMADLMQGRGRLTGVDVSVDRLHVCRKMVVRYRVGDNRRRVGEVAGAEQQQEQEDEDEEEGEEERQQRGDTAEGGECNGHGVTAEGQGGEDRPLVVRLVQADGRTFGARDEEEEGRVVFDSRAFDWEGMERRGQRRSGKGEKERERRRMRAMRRERQEAEGSGGYDRVLVDAECTHDGSLRHMAKVVGLSSDRLDRGFLNMQKLEGLTDLQRELIRNGFRQLRAGGVMVYSTCSLSTEQNEAVLAHLLEAEPTARLEPISFHEHGDDDDDDGGAAVVAPPCRPGSLPGTWYFEPRLGTSGLFVSRIRKAAEDA